MVRARDKSPEAFGWQKIELKPNAGSVLLPLSWGLMPLVLTVIVYMTETGLDYINFLGAGACLLYTSPSPRDISGSRMPSSA